MTSSGATTLKVFVVAVFLFLPAPVIVVVLSSFAASGQVSLPVSAPTLRWYQEFLTSAEWLSVFGTSALLAAIAATVSTVCALLAALAVHRRGFPGSAAFETLLLAPLVFPHAAIGVIMIALLREFGALGTFSGLVLAHAILTVPFAYRPIANNLRSLDPEIEEAATSLGARPLTVFLSVTLPGLRPGLVTAGLFTAIISFDEATVTMFLVGPDVMTAPVRVFTEVLESASPVVNAVSAFMILLTVASVTLLDRLVGLRFFVDKDGAR